MMIMQGRHINMHYALLTLTLLLCSTVYYTAAKATKGSSKGGSNLADYQQTLDIVAENINKATEKSEELINKHMSAVDKDPGSLITKEVMQKIIQGSSFLPQKAGTRSVVLESKQGFNGISNYQPSGWKIVETMSGPKTSEPEPSAEKEQVVTYPVGLGPVLLNGCTGTNYTKTSPCYNSKLFNLQNTICTKQIDAANFIGVGFDGRGRYRSESRRSSIIQRSCANRATFMGQDIPDTMNIFGIYDTTAETKSFQSVDQYMKYIRHKAGLSNQKNLFISEASKFSQASSFGINLGGIGAIVGGAIGAVAGGPVGAAMGATLGGVVGGSISGGSGSGSGSESATDKGESSSKMEQTDESSGQQSSTQNFFAIMYVNVILYEITLDEVKPTDISLAALKDYMSLPVSYYSIGADAKYQNFLLRWGTHYVRSAKFGGQLKVTKTAKSGKFSSEQDFASYAETEFQAMFATLQSKYSQKSSSWGFLGIGGSSKEASQSSNAKSESSYSSTMDAKRQQLQNYRQSEFTQTSVEAQGGISEIAEALIDFYTPAFGQLFHSWLVSIKDYAKPFEFQLRPVNELFNVNMESLFPAGNLDFGCVGSGNKVDILVDPKTKERYYIDTETSFSNGNTVTTKIRVNCKYSNISDFKTDMQRRKVSLERAVGVYMAEGPFPTTSFELQGGEPGCEEATKAQFNFFGNSSVPLRFSDLLRQPFLIVFNLPESVPGVVDKQAKYMMEYRYDNWFAIDPSQELVNLYDGCQVAKVKANEMKVCFKNLILTYVEKSGFFYIERSDFAASKQRIPSLPYWLAGTKVARSRRMSIQNSNTKGSNRGSIPCQIKWLNSHRLDPNKKENCIHFTAATEGDLFVVFASIPRDHTTWYYLQISPEGVGFYHAMQVQKFDHKKGMGMLGDKNLFQTFFVCVSQASGRVTIQYGKADPDSEIGTVYSSYIFAKDSQFSRLSFYSFGAGIKSVSLMDVRLTKLLPKMVCLGEDYMKKDGHCVLKCHAECIGCKYANNSKACHQCKNVRVETGSGASRVVDCISQCPVAKYLSQSKEKLCVPCEAGTFKAAVGNQECTQCKEGIRSPVGATKCGECPAGSVLSSNKQKCDICPAGKFAAKGASICSICVMGKFSEAGQAECKLCPHGYYGNTTGLAKCTPCSVGYFAPTRGMTSCTKCAPGSVSGEGSRVCTKCNIGEYSSEPSVPCAKCKAGFFAPGVGMTSCTKCSSDTYSDPGSGNCTLCPPGQFRSQPGATCSKCPAGSFASSGGSKKCEKCPLGTYAASTGASNCSQCPVGHFAVPPLGGYKCLKCPSVFSAAAAGSSSCKNCPSNGLAKSDGGSCYRKISFKTCTSSAPFTDTVGTDWNCRNVINNNRGYPGFHTKNQGDRYLVVEFNSKSTIRKVVVWRRPEENNRYQINNVRVEIMLGGTERRSCGTLTSTNKSYIILNCDSGNEKASGLRMTPTDNTYMAFLEVEAYTD